jgi:hypothetical protein
LECLQLFSRRGFLERDRFTVSVTFAIPFSIAEPVTLSVSKPKSKPFTFSESESDN